MSTEDAIGFVRLKHRRIGEDVQRSALNEDGVRGIVIDRAALERMATDGRVFKARHIFLFAEPRARKKAGGWRKDLMSFIARMDKKGAVLKDVDLQLRSDVPGERVKLIEAAIEQLATNGRTTHLEGRRTGRRPLVFPPAVERQVELIWRNVRDYPEQADAEAAIKAVAGNYSKERARRTYGPRIKRK